MEIDAELSWIQTLCLHVVIVRRAEQQHVFLAWDKSLDWLRNPVHLSRLLFEHAEIVPIQSLPAVLNRRTELRVGTSADAARRRRLHLPAVQPMVEIIVADMAWQIAEAIFF